MRYKIFLSAAFILILSIIFYRCINKQDSEILPDTTTNTPTINTLPGGYFAASEGSFSLQRYDSTWINYTPQSGKCDYSSDLHVLSLKSTVSGAAFVSVYFKANPHDSSSTLSLAIVPFNEQELDNTNAWATITTVNDSKTWRAVSGTLYVNVSDSLVSGAYFDTVKVENASAITDTVMIRASARLYCK